MSPYCSPCTVDRTRQRAKQLVGKPDLTLPARFWAKVDKDAPDGHWLWTGHILKFGYGCIFAHGKKARAHRMVYEVLGLPIPPAHLVVDHVCRVRHCVNPDHLRIVTETVNAHENNDSPFAQNRRKTECKYGHPLTPDNVRMVSYLCRKGRPVRRTTRVCVECVKRRNQAYAAKIAAKR